MSYRDWGRGEGSPREREPIATWDESDISSVDPSRSAARYRTPSPRRAIERAPEEPVDEYLPRWAVESGVRRADGGGRHAAPDDDDDDESSRPGSRADWRTTETTSSWRGVRETSWRELPAIGAGPESDHTREWTSDRPQDQGYVGSRRAESAKDEPVSGSFAERRPRRAPTGRPQVTWSGGDESPSTADPASRRDPDPFPRRDPDPPGRRRRRAAEAEDSWSRPPADPWGGAARRTEDPEPTYQPPVDPWDASGVHAWPPAAGTGRWDTTDRWDTTGQWGQPEAGGRWEQPDSTGQFDRYTDPGRWDRTEPPRSGPAAEPEGWSWSGQDDGFWSGTRLAGDDPRWMDPPTSAPRSPVVTYTAPRPRSAPGAYGPSRRRAEPVGAPRGSGVASVRRRIEAVGTGGWPRRLEDDLLDPDPGGPFRSLLYTAACYLLPALLIFVWLLTLDSRAPEGCVTDISGGGCDSPRAHALGSLVAAAPRFGLALVSSLVVAALLRRVGTTWRATTIALASAVVGGGLSTVVISVVTGQPIG
ncbi:hypothetical protein [Micromonospora sp. WMMD812]|uniref:hypothetical protein n=1 Tax=Micromonospora sp. WMMD812 TaxID=3015152 RepID=UPI00248CF601|nr:hypothetical protein [Micromonospora sp. WMMD812]WBB65808.1 hypothetical protein O7603_21760 [Micromonospora sp. WMMD812]